MVGKKIIKSGPVLSLFFATPPYPVPLENRFHTASVGRYHLVPVHAVPFIGKFSLAAHAILASYRPEYLIFLVDRFNLQSLYWRLSTGTGLSFVMQYLFFMAGISTGMPVILIDISQVPGLSFIAALAGTLIVRQTNNTLMKIAARCIINFSHWLLVLGCILARYLHRLYNWTSSTNPIVTAGPYRATPIPNGVALPW